MKKILLFSIIYFLFAILSGCSKISEYYLFKSEKIISSQSVTKEQVSKAYEYIEKSLKYNPDSKRSLEVLDNLTNLAYKAGYEKALEIEISILKKFLQENPYQWPAYTIMINAMALRGDIFMLNEMSVRVAKIANTLFGKKGYYEANLVLGLIYAASIPWVESEGFVNLNKNSSIVFEKMHEYIKLINRLSEVANNIQKFESAQSSAKSRDFPELVSAFEIAYKDVFSNIREIERMKNIAKKIETDKSFARGVEMVIQGNVFMVKKEYSKARAMYVGAINHVPWLIDAKKQIVEADFQEGAKLAVRESDTELACQLLHKAREESENVIESARKSGNFMPFVKTEKFLAEIFSLKAAIVSAINLVEKDNSEEQKQHLKFEFHSALNEALKYDPENKLARELLDRYTKGAF